MKAFFFAVLIFPVFAQAQKLMDSTFVITGDIKGLPEKSEVFLTDGNNGKDTLTKAFVKGGIFVLSGHIPEPNIFELNFVAQKKKTALFIGNDKISITGTADNLKELQVSGSPSHNDFMDFQKIFNPYIAQLNAVTQSSNSPQGSAKADSLSKVYSGIVTSIEASEDNFIETKKSSYVSPFILIVLLKLSDDVMLLEKRFTKLSPQVQNSFYGKYLQQQIADGKVGAVGTNALDFTQNDTTGKPVTLSSFKGKYVLVDFWASWCGPCRRDNPNVVSIYKKFRTKNFTIIGVSLDESKVSWIKAINEDGLTWTHVSDLKHWNNDVAAKYHIQSIPQNLLIDPSGKIIGKNLHGSELQDKLCELLGCN